MKKYKVKINFNFNDIVEKVQRKLGDNETEVFFCNQERYEYLKSRKAVELVEIVEEENEKSTDVPRGTKAQKTRKKRITEVD